MELKSLNCPNCGGSVNIPEGVSRFYCTYCGSQIQVDDGKITIDLNANINLEHRYTDVARLKELNIQEQLRKKEEDAALQMNNKEKKEKKTWLIATFSTILIGGVSAGLFEKCDLYLLFSIFLVCVFLMPIWAIAIPASFFDNKPTTKGKLLLAFVFFVVGTAMMGAIHALFMR